MAENIEWFPFYWQRFLLGTRGFSAQEIGGYLLLLMHEWDQGFIPDSEEEIRNICRIPHKNIDKILKKFRKIDGKFYNDVLEIVRMEAQEKIEKRSSSGRKAAKQRWENHANALHSHSECNAQYSTVHNNTKQESTDSANASFFLELEKLSLVMQRQFSWLEAIAKKYKCRKEFCAEKIHDFILHLETQAITGKTLKDAQSHYDNWFRKQIENAQRNSKTGKQSGLSQDAILAGFKKEFPDSKLFG